MVGTFDLPTTQDISAREVTLPLHPLLSMDDVDEIVARLAQAVGSLLPERVR
jgi:dTDP-4-amino-4,6-dideoxygalactose transaminase